MVSLANLFVFCGFFVSQTNAHNYGAHYLEGGDPTSPVPTFPRIGGAFDITIRARFDNATAKFQTLFEFHNGGGSDRIWFGQSGSTASFNLLIQNGATGSLYVANWVNSDAFVIGQVHDYRVGANSTDSWIYRDGIPLNVRNHSPILPRDVVRSEGRVGESNLGMNPIDGAILGFKVKSEAAGSTALEMWRHWNLSGQVNGPFTISFFAKFRKIADNPYQPVVQWYNRDSRGFVIETLYVGASSGKMFFQISYGPSAYAAYLFGSIEEDEWALWHCSIDANGDMTIQKHGEISSDSTTKVHSSPTAPIRQFRKKYLIGSHTHNSNVLHGAVLGLRLDPHTKS